MAATGESNAPLPDVDSAESSVREVNGTRLHVVRAGEPDDPLVVLLHGFPEFWYAWREYVDGFVSAGYRVVVPDQRGYNRSGKPVGIRSYRLGTIASDVVSLIEAEGRDRAAIVGHDWGANVAWDVSLRYPESVASLGVVNNAHPVVYHRTVRRDLTQFRRSWYGLFFQLPRLPEWYLSRNDFAPIVHQMRNAALPDAFTETDFSRYRRAWSEPRAMHSMLDWYRAFLRLRDVPDRRRVDVPTLIVWGDNDHTMVPSMAERSAAYCDSGTVERFPDGTHWILREYPDRVLMALLDHLDRHYR